MKSGRDIGREHLGTLQAFLQLGTPLPSARDGTINLTELARLTGIPKSSFYQNPSIRALVEGMRPLARAKTPSNAAEPPADSAPGTPSAVPADATQSQRLERRIHSLEQQNTSLVAENLELRKQLKALRLQMGRQDMMIDTARRIIAPPASS